MPYSRRVIEAGNACRRVVSTPRHKDAHPVPHARRQAKLTTPGPGSASDARAGAPSTVRYFPPEERSAPVRPGPEVVSGVVWPASVRVRDNGDN
jgi:hypothetical protein